MEKQLNVLVVGAGARERALIWRIRQSPRLSQIFLSAELGIQDSHKEGLLVFAKENKIGLTVVGPETPLADGIVDLFQANDLLIFGPTKEAAKLEWSKRFAIEVMRGAGIPHPQSWFFDTPGAAYAFSMHYGKPVVVKADGLDAGKGVFLCHTVEEVLKAAKYCVRRFPGRPIVVQELLKGREVSVFCFTDGYHISSLVAACDYKRVGEGNTGAMTGGMGSYAWPEFWTEDLEQEILVRVMRPVLRAMEQRGTPFQGVLYAGLMITQEDPKVLEFNCRFGDPEAQVILPLLETDPLEVMLACVRGELDLTRVDWNKEESAVGVVIASQGYPGTSVEGPAVDGLEKLDPEILVFQGRDSGRMMTLVAKARRVEDAAEMVYENIRGRLNLHNVFYRGDIAAEVLR